MPMENIPSVLHHGILCYERMAKLPHKSVAMQPVRDRRDIKRVPGGRMLHQYANLYFHARNPMMCSRQQEAPQHELTEEFLSAPSQLSLEGRGRKHEKMNPEWVVLVEVLRELGAQPYAPPVGRVIFQKICYVLTEMGVKTGFEFGKGSYGPFANEVKLALNDFANRNWLQEDQLGQMMALRVGQQYAI